MPSSAFFLAATCASLQEFAVPDPVKYTPVFAWLGVLTTCSVHFAVHVHVLLSFAQMPYRGGPPRALEARSKTQAVSIVAATVTVVVTMKSTNPVYSPRAPPQVGLRTPSPARPVGSIMSTGSPSAYKYLCRDGGSWLKPSSGPLLRNLPVTGL